MRPRTAAPASPLRGARRPAFVSMAERCDMTRNSILRISDEKTIQLIQEWEKEECLWNTTLPHYPNKEERMFAVAIIAEKLDLPNFTPDHVAMKFKNLRNSYCQELKKMGSDKTYKPKVFWFPYMDKFLKPHLQKIQTYGTEASKASNEIPKTPNIYHIIKTEIESDSDIEQDWSVENSMQSEASCSNSVQVESGGSKQAPAKKRKLSAAPIKLGNREDASCSENWERTGNSPTVINSDENQSSTSQTKEISANQAALRTEPRKLDHCDTFGDYVASLLRTLPTKKALFLQSKIVRMIVAAGVEEPSDDDSDS